MQEPQPLAKCERGRRPRQHVETVGSHGFSDGRSHELARRVLDSGDPQLDRPQPGLLLATSHPLRGTVAPPARPGAWASKRSLSSHRTSAWGMNRALERDGVSTGHRPGGRFEAAVARPPSVRPWLAKLGVDCSCRTDARAKNHTNALAAGRITARKAWVIGTGIVIVQVQVARTAADLVLAKLGCHAGGCEVLPPPGRRHAAGPATG